MESAEHSKKESFLKKVGPNLYRATSGTYYLLVKRGGKQFRRSLRTTDQALARRRLREFQDKAARLPGDSSERNLRFEELSARWLASRQGHLKASSYNRRVTALKGLAPFFNGHVVRSLGLRELEEWKTKRGSKLAARSWNIEVETLKQVLDYAKDDLRILVDNPLTSLKRRKECKAAIVIPSKEQFRVVLSELRQGHKATGEAADFVEFLGYSGCRQGEAASIQWNDVNFVLATLRITGGVTGTKNHEWRSIPLFQPLRRLLASIRTRKTEVGGSVFEIRDARLQINRACERLGLPRYGHHTMRHFFCSNAIEAGCDFKVIAEWLGHKDGGVLVARTYGHLRNEHSAAMAQRIVFDAAETIV
ncbi:MAG: site-specific integrase [Chthoniobacterales bacterium]